MLTHPLVSIPPPPPETPPPPEIPPPPPVPFWPEFWILFALGLLAAAIVIYVEHYFNPTLLTLYLDVHEYASAHTLIVIGTADTLITIALIVGLGLAAARPLGLGAPIIEATLRPSNGVRHFPPIKSILGPAIIVGILVGLCTLLLHSPLLRASRAAHEQRSNDDYNQFIHSPAGEKLNQVENRMAHTYGFRVTPSRELLLLLAGAIDNNLLSRLFLFSCALWILVKLNHSPPLQPSTKLICLAVVAAYAVYLLYSQVEIHVSGLIFAPYLVGLPIHGDPTWLYILDILRDSVLWLPVQFLLCWLYLRRGPRSLHPRLLHRRPYRRLPLALGPHALTRRLAPLYSTLFGCPTCSLGARGSSRGSGNVQL